MKAQTHEREAEFNIKTGWFVFRSEVSLTCRPDQTQTYSTSTKKINKTQIHLCVCILCDRLLHTSCLYPEVKGQCLTHAHSPEVLSSLAAPVSLEVPEFPTKHKKSVVMNQTHSQKIDCVRLCIGEAALRGSVWKHNTAKRKQEVISGNFLFGIVCYIQTTCRHCIQLCVMGCGGRCGLFLAHDPTVGDLVHFNYLFV